MWCYQFMEKNIRNVVGPRIYEARMSEKPPATQADISARLQGEGIELSDSSIGKIENQSTAVRDVQLLAFAKVLKVSAAWLLGETDDKRRN